MTFRFQRTVFGLTLLVVAAVASAAFVDEYKSGIIWPLPPLVDAGPGPMTPAPIPSDSIVLFDGKDMSAWQGGENWIVADGVATAAKNGVTSHQSFGDCQLHLEFATPEKVEGKGQGRGNSGIYFMGQYELQILDSHDNDTYFDGQCSAIYKQQPPTVNASRKPGEWQTYDVLFSAPRFADDGQVTTPGFITVLHNGVMTHNHFELQGATSYTEPPKYTKHADKMPFHLQFHGNPTRFRNIWVRENVAPLIGKKP